MRIYSPTPVLGYGYNIESFTRVIAETPPDMIAADAGSTDPGPYYLGSGTSFTDYELVKRDLGPMLKAALDLGIPLVIGTSGGAGGKPHLDTTRQAVEEIADEFKLRFRLTLIHAEQSAESVKNALAAGRIRPLHPVKQLTPETIDNATRIVGLMGVEPFLRAFEEGAQVILAGRSDDAALFAAYAIRNGISPASAWLSGKFLECGGACAVPRHKFGLDGVIADVSDDEVLLTPSDLRVACTRRSISTFLLHENESPVSHIEPSGTLNLKNLRIEQADPRSVRMTGQKFDETDQKTIRLEGVELVGYRTIVVAWTRDPLLISVIDDYLERARQKITDRISRGRLVDGDYVLDFRLIGKDAVMGPREPVKEIRSHELGIIIDVVAPTQREASLVAAAARTLIKNFEYPGKLCDEGCITFPYSPSETEVGAVYRFSIWHLLENPDMHAIFPVEHVEVGHA